MLKMPLRTMPTMAVRTALVLLGLLGGLPVVAPLGGLLPCAMPGLRHPGYLLLRGGFDATGRATPEDTAGSAARNPSTSREMRAGDGAGHDDAPSAAPLVPVLPVATGATRPRRPAMPVLQLGPRKGVVRALKKGFGFIRMQTLEGEPSPTDVFFDYADQEAARVKMVHPGAKVLFTLNYGPKRMLRGYSVSLDGGGDLRNLTEALREV